MRRLLAGLFLVSLMFPILACAQSAPLSRRDGFLLIWNSIRRAAEDNREKYFTDVPAGTPGETEITYAKYRGILDDPSTSSGQAGKFFPDEPLMMQDALLWLYRTRSVDDITKLTVAELPVLLKRYPVGDFLTTGSDGEESVISSSVSEEQLLSIMQKLDGLLAAEVHEVSLYSEKFQGKGTAFGDTFDMNELTAAHRTFPHNTLVKVTNIANGKSVTIRVNDRGPYVEGRDMDLSLAAFTSIEDRSKGVLHATFQRLGDATLVSQCSDTDTRRAIRITKNVRLIGGVPVSLPLGQSLMFRSTRAFVVRTITYPDGTVADIQDWVIPGESHPFTPSIGGQYTFRFGGGQGGARELTTTVVSCADAK